jgi:Condensation domain
VSGRASAPAPPSTKIRPIDFSTSFGICLSCNFLMEIEDMPSDPHEIVFDGGADRIGPTTWSQREILATMRRLPGRQAHFNLNFPVPVPAGTSLEQIHSAVRELVEHHESLRTTIVVDPNGQARQLVHGHGRVPLRTFYDGDPGNPTSAPAVVRAVQATPVGFAGEDCIRTDLISDNATSVLRLTVSHVALDGFGIAVLQEDLDRLLRGAPLASTPISPLTRAEYESAAGGQARSARSLAQASAQLRAAPRSFLEYRSPADGRAGSHWVGQVHSRALGSALGMLSVSTGLPPAAILIAVAGTVLAAKAEAEAFTALVISSNRFEPLLRRYVGTVFQAVPVTVNVEPAGCTATAAVTARTVAGACMRGQFDPGGFERLVSDLELERGRAVYPWLTFNVHIPAPPAGSAWLESDLRLRLGQSTYASRPMWGLEEPGVYLTALGDGDSVVLTLRANTSRLSITEAEDLLLAVERRTLALVLGAASGTTNGARFAAKADLAICACADQHRQPPVTV